MGRNNNRVRGVKSIFACFILLVGMYTDIFAGSTEINSIVMLNTSDSDVQYNAIVPVQNRIHEDDRDSEQIYQEVLTTESVLDRASEATGTDGVYRAVETSGTDALYETVLPVKDVQNRTENNIEVSYDEQLAFHINPNNSIGNNQITSPAYSVKNSGTTDVKVTISDFKLNINDENIKVRTSPLGMEQGLADEKSIYMFLTGKSDWMADDINLIADSGDEISFTLSADSDEVNNQAVFKLSGAVTLCAGNDWKDDDLKLSFMIQYEPVDDAKVIENDTLYETTATDYK